MLVIEQRQLISRKNLVGCDTIITRKPLCAKIDGIEWNNTNFRREGFLLFLFLRSTTKELKLTIKKKNILTTKGKFCYNNRRYFLLLVSQECTGTFRQMFQKYTQMIAVTKCIITKNKKTQENVDAYN